MRMRIRLLPLIGALLFAAACPSSRSNQSGTSDDTTPDGGEPDTDALVPSFYVDTWTGLYQLETGEFRVESAHYVLTAQVDQTEATSLGHDLEAGYAAFARYFGRELSLGAKERLAVKVFADADAFAEGLPPDGASAKEDSGGYYSPVTKTAYLYSQGNSASTRTLLHHEAIHQYLHLLRGKNVALPFWYVEGLAEDLSRHEFDGAYIRAGVRPLLSGEDMPKQALEEARSPGFSVATIVNDKEYAKRPGAWALHRFLELGATRAYREAFHQYRDALEAGTGDPAQLFTELIGDPDSLTAPLKEWLEASQEPMEPIFRNWVPIGPRGLGGHSPTSFGIALVKRPVSHFEMHYDVGGASKWSVGTMLAYQDASNFVSLVLTSDGELHTFTNTAGSARWSRVGEISSNLRGHRGVLCVDFTPGQQDVIVNGATFTFHEAWPARGGIWVNDTWAKFEKLDWY